MEIIIDIIDKMRDTASADGEIPTDIFDIVDKLRGAAPADGEISTPKNTTTLRGDIGTVVKVVNSGPRRVSLAAVESREMRVLDEGRMGEGDEDEIN